MADLAIAFRWAPRDMDGMSLSDLMRWRTLAIDRLKPDR